MTGIKDIAVSTGTIYQIDPRDLHVEENFNVRDENDNLNDHIESLAASISEVGILQPLTGRMVDDKLFITDGHCRYRAAMLCIERGVELRSVPVRLEPKHTSEADHIMSLLVRNSGKPLEPYEAARVYKRLIALGWSISEVAKKSGKSLGYVGALLDLASAPAEITNLVKSGEVSATTAIAVIRDSENHGEAATILQLAAEDARAEHASQAEDAAAQQTEVTADNEDAEPAKRKPGRPKGSGAKKETKPKTARVTAKHVRKVKNALSGEPESSPVPAVPAAPVITVSQEVIEAISSDKLLALFAKIASFNLIEGQDAWSLEDTIKEWVAEAHEIITQTQDA